MDPMPASKFHALIGKAMADAEFRAQLVDPSQQAKALQSMDIEPTDDVLSQLNTAIASINNLATFMGEPVAAA
jgi:hypothetical protein